MITVTTIMTVLMVAGCVNAKLKSQEKEVVIRDVKGRFTKEEQKIVTVSDMRRSLGLTNNFS